MTTQQPRRRPVEHRVYKVVESPPRASRSAAGHVASVGRSAASVHVILTTDAARALARLVGDVAMFGLPHQTRTRVLDPQLWAAVALDLEAAAELGDLDAADGPADIFAIREPAQLVPKHRDDSAGAAAAGAAWTKTVMEHNPRHRKAPR